VRVSACSRERAHWCVQSSRTPDKNKLRDHAGSSLRLTNQHLDPKGVGVYKPIQAAASVGRVSTDAVLCLRDSEFGPKPGRLRVGGSFPPGRRKKPRAVGGNQDLTREQGYLYNIQFEYPASSFGPGSCSSRLWGNTGQKK